MTALSKQEGGSHYKDYAYQPIELAVKNNYSFIQGNIVKYIIRHQDKNGVEDLKKVIHYAELAIELGETHDGFMEKDIECNKFLVANGKTPNGVYADEAWSKFFHALNSAHWNEVIYFANSELKKYYDYEAPLAE